MSQFILDAAFLLCFAACTFNLLVRVTQMSLIWTEDDTSAGRSVLDMRATPAIWGAITVILSVLRDVYPIFEGLRR